MDCYKVGFRKYIICVKTKDIKETEKISNAILSAFPKIKLCVIGMS